QLAAAPERRPLHVVDRVLAAEHEDEEELREPARVADHDPRADALPPGEPRNVEAGAVHELLEHQRVLPLLDALVVRVAELGRPVREAERELEEPALEDVLELHADL